MEANNKLKHLESLFEDIHKSMSDYIISNDCFFMKTTGDYLKEYLTAIKNVYGIPNKKMAEFWGIKPLTISRYCNNKKNFNVDFIKKISTTFNVPPSIWIFIQGDNDTKRLRSLMEHRTALQNKCIVLRGH